MHFCQFFWFVYMLVFSFKCVLYVLNEKKKHAKKEDNWQNWQNRTNFILVHLIVFLSNDLLHKSNEEITKNLILFLECIIYRTSAIIIFNCSAFYAIICCYLVVIIQLFLIASTQFRGASKSEKNAPQRFSLDINGYGYNCNPANT